MDGVTEKKCGAETEGMTIQRLPPPVDPSHIQSPNSNTIVDTNKCLLIEACYSCLWRVPDKPAPDKHKGGYSQPII